MVLSCRGGLGTLALELPSSLWKSGPTPRLPALGPELLASAQPGLSRRVHTDVQQVLSHLRHPRFTFAQSEAEADILYHFSHFKDYR